MYYYTEEDDNVFRAEAAARERKTKEEAEIIRLRAKIETLERKLYDEGEAILALNHQLLTVRAETSKEFAKRLKEQKYQSSDWSHGEHPFVVEESDIDNVLFEMAGDVE